MIFKVKIIGFFNFKFIQEKFMINWAKPAISKFIKGLWDTKRGMFDEEQQKNLGDLISKEFYNLIHIIIGLWHKSKALDSKKL